MRVLVTAASRHGGTDEIAKRIGDELGKALDFPALEVHVRPADEVDDILTYDAAVIGSAIYMGRWQEPARASARPGRRRVAGGRGPRRGRLRHRPAAPPRR